MANRSSWTEVLVLILFAAVPAAIIALSCYSAARSSHPTDEELTARFLSHEADFQALCKCSIQTTGECRSRDEPFDLPDLVAAGVARRSDYEVLLARIGATDFRCYPQSGNARSASLAVRRAFRGN